ncbi:MAG: hypothetical protein IPH84_18350 [Bacteroidales bacterium]|nr:hypothetical protein [Bacteroidales bacterium]
MLSTIASLTAGKERLVCGKGQGNRTGSDIGSTDVYRSGAGADMLLKVPVPEVDHSRVVAFATAEPARVYEPVLTDGSISTCKTVAAGVMVMSSDQWRQYSASGSEGEGDRTCFTGCRGIGQVRVASSERTPVPELVRGMRW